MKTIMEYVIVIGMMILIVFEILIDIIQSKGKEKDKDNEEEIHTDCMWK